METFDLKGMGERIRTRREELNISREQLAEQLDVSSKFISDIEYGIRGVSIKRLVLLSSSLLISVDYILFGSLESSEYVFTDLIHGVQILKLRIFILHYKHCCISTPKDAHFF